MTKSTQMTILLRQRGRNPLYNREKDKVDIDCPSLWWGAEHAEFTNASTIKEHEEKHLGRKSPIFTKYLYLSVHTQDPQALYHEISTRGFTVADSKIGKRE